VSSSTSSPTNQLKKINKSVPTLIIVCGIETHFSLWLDRFSKKHRDHNELVIFDTSIFVKQVWDILFESISRADGPDAALVLFKRKPEDWREKAPYQHVYEQTDRQINLYLKQAYLRYFTEENWPALQLLESHFHYYAIDWRESQKFHPSLRVLKEEFPNHLRIFYSSGIYSIKFKLYQGMMSETQDLPRFTRFQMEQALRNLEPHIHVKADVYPKPDDPFEFINFPRLFRHCKEKNTFDVSEDGLKDYPLVPYVQEAVRTKFPFSPKLKLETLNVNSPHLFIIEHWRNPDAIEKFVPNIMKP
jgi:hypothetical protein